MKVRMNNVYGISGVYAYYRKDGDCFSFAATEKNATDMSVEDANKVLEHSDWYCKQFGAESMCLVE